MLAEVDADDRISASRHGMLFLHVAESMPGAGVMPRPADRQLSRDRSRAAPKKPAFFDHPCHFGWNHFFPGAVARLQFCQRLRRINPQVFRMIIADLFNVVIVDEMLEERS